MGIDDPYTAYCLDEACAFIHTKLQKGEEPVIPKEEEPEPVHYSSPSEFYKKFDN